MIGKTIFGQTYMTI